MIISNITLSNVGYVVDVQPIVIPGLVFNLDAANYSAMPTNGTKDATGTYTISVTNTNSSLAWNSASGGVFSKTTSNASDLFTTSGPVYGSAQPYTVFMAYQATSTATGRLLNTNASSPDWLLGTYGPFGTYGYTNVYYPNTTVNLNSDTGDANWHFIWGTSNGSNSSNLYIASSTVNNISGPTAVYKSAASSSGFNGFSLFGRYVNGSSITEIATANVGFVKVYNNELTIPQIKALWSQYHSRFGI